MQTGSCDDVASSQKIFQAIGECLAVKSGGLENLPGTIVLRDETVWLHQPFKKQSHQIKVQCV